MLGAGAWLVCPQGVCAVMALDRWGLDLAHGLRSEALDAWMQGVTWLGSLILLLPLLSLWAWRLAWLGRRREALFVMLALLGTSALSHLVKLWVVRPRPDLFPALQPLPADWSYPSAHAMQATAAALALFLVWSRGRTSWAAPLALALGLVVLLVGLSRIYLQAHFPSDVLAGTLAAALWVVGLHAWMLGRPVKCRAH